MKTNLRGKNRWLAPGNSFAAKYDILKNVSVEDWSSPWSSFPAAAAERHCISMRSQSRRPGSSGYLRKRKFADVEAFTAEASQWAKETP